jgi:hypothetical protein
VSSHTIPPKKGTSIATGQASLLPRYEDVTQDGRLQLTALMPGLGASAWRAMQRELPSIETFAKQGILPILRRLVLVGEGGPVSVHVPIDYEGHAELARETGGDRLFLNMWAEARAPKATTFGPRPEPSAETHRVGRLFAEHIITRPFGPKEDRKVTRLDAPGLPSVPPEEHPYEATEHLVEGVDLTIASIVEFGMMHTDSNQHVNSLVYPRMFEEAVLRHLGPSAKNLLARSVEMRWRKPFFAGDKATLRLGTFDGKTAYGTFVPVDGDPARPSCAIKMTLG